MTGLPLKPCRFCGEDDPSRLRLQDGAFSELRWGVDADGRVLRDARGEPFADSAEENGSDDGVFCGVCEALVPLRVWNGDPDWLARMRASILEADTEFDEDGVWQGRKAVAA